MKPCVSSVASRRFTALIGNLPTRTAMPCRCASRSLNPICASGGSVNTLLGLAALATDVASWQVAQKSMQGAADAAVYSAEIASNKADGTSLVTQAKAVTAALGFIDGQKGRIGLGERAADIGQLHQQRNRDRGHCSAAAVAISVRLVFID